MTSIEHGSQTDSETDFGNGKTVTSHDLRAQIFENQIFGKTTFVCPTALLQLESLSDIINRKTWNELISQEDRNQLKHLLPQVPNQDHLLESLLSEENFWFGKPLQIFFQKLKEGSSSEFVVASKDHWIDLSKQNHNQFLFNYQCNMIKSVQKFRSQFQLDSERSEPIVHNPIHTIGNNVETESEPELDMEENIPAVISKHQMNAIDLAKEFGDGEDSFTFDIHNKKRRLDAC